MIDSLRSIDKRCIFRETFNDESSVIRNGGVISGAGSAATFKNGSVILPINKGIAYPNFNKSNSVVSIRVRANISTLISTYLCDFRMSGTGAGYFYFTGGGVIGASSGTVYTNGGNGDAPTANKMMEYVVSGMTINTKRLVIGTSNGLSGVWTSEIELFEIYSGTLTADEVKNLYENKRYREVGAHDEQLGVELVSNGGFNDLTGWSVGQAYPPTGNVTASAGRLYIERIAGASYQDAYYDVANLTTGKRYKFTVNYKKEAGTSGIVYLGYAGSLTAYWNSGGLPSDGNYTFYFVATNTSLRISLFSYLSGTITSWDNVSIKEVLTNSTKLILDVNAFDGVARNRLSGNTVGNELCQDPYLDDASKWDLKTNVIVQNGIATFSPSATLFKGAVITVGKLYRLTYTVVSISPGNSGIQTGVGSTGLGTKRTTTGTFTEDIVCSGALGLYFFTGGGFISGSIDNISFKEVIPWTINTAVTVGKENDLNVIKFGASTSKIDCGGYDPLTGDRTISLWIKSKTRGGSFGVAGSHIISNEKLALLHYTSGTTLTIAMISDGNTLIHMGAMQNLFNRWMHIAIVRASTGLTSMYVDGVLAGAANRPSGTPTAPSVNLAIGNSSTNNRSHDGSIGAVKIYDGLLTSQEIAQIYTNEKSKYGL